MAISFASATYPVSPLVGQCHPRKAATESMASASPVELRARHIQIDRLAILTGQPFLAGVASSLRVSVSHPSRRVRVAFGFAGPLLGNPAMRGASSSVHALFIECRCRLTCCQCLVLHHHVYHVYESSRFHFGFLTVSPPCRQHVPCSICPRTLHLPLCVRPSMRYIVILNICFSPPQPRGRSMPTCCGLPF